MKKISTEKKRSLLRDKRTKARIYKGGVTRPRLCVSKTNKHIFLQIINDIEGKTIVSVSDKEVAKKNAKRMDLAKELGGVIAKKAQEKDVKQIVFDRGGFKYHGIVKAIAEGAREGGLDF